MKSIIFIISFFCTVTISVKGQELNVEQTLEYINKKLNDRDNKYSPIRVYTFIPVTQASSRDIDRFLMTDYTYSVTIKNGLLVVKREFTRNGITRVVEESSAPLKEINNNQSESGVKLDTHYDYSSGSDYSGSYSADGGAASISIWGRDFAMLTTKVSKEYSNEGIETSKKTERERFLAIKFSNRNLIAENLKNAFVHLINLASSDSIYNTIDLVNKDPFSNPIKNDTISSNSIPVVNSNSIPMKKVGGVYEIPVLINGVLKLNFIFDAGASDVSISPDVALTLIRTGTVSDKDFLGTETYRFADGSTAKSKVFMIREIQLGNKKVNNVKASISSSVNAPLLLGQSVLNKFGKVTIDYNKGVIIFQD